MIRNNRFATFLFFFFVLIGGLKSQDNVMDLRKASHLLSIAQERDRLVSQDLEEVKSQRFRLEEDLLDLQNNKNAKAEKKKIEIEVKGLLKKEDELQTRKKYATNLLNDVTDILKAEPKKRTKFIQDYEKRFGPIKFEEMIDNQAVTKSAPPVVEPPKPKNDPIAQLEKESSNLPKVVENAPVLNETTSAVSKEKPKETPKKTTKQVKPKPIVVAQTENKPKEKPKTETKPKVKEPTKKPKKTEDFSAETTVSAETEPKKHVLKEPKPKAKKEKQTTPKVDTPSVSTVSESSNEPQNAVVAVETEPVKTPEKTKKEKKPAPVKVKTESSKTNINYKKYDPKEDVMALTPLSSDCNLAFDGMDNFTGKKKQETVPIVLFAHTDDFMRATMKDKEFVTCEVTATRVEGSRTVYLNLKMTIQSKDAQRTFGFLDRGALIIFRFINGKKVNLTTNKTDIGAVDVDKGTTTFRAQLAIAEPIELTASELDAIRVSWSIGYEDYEIFDMDVLRNLFKCLDKK